MGEPGKYRHRLSAIEAIALCVLVAAATIQVHRRFLQPHFYFSAEGMREIETLKRFGLSNHSSRNHEELIARDFFADKRDGVFLDVGANHHHVGNNTYFLETSLGWSGIAVDALEEFAPGYAQHRPRTRYVAMFASDVADSRVKFFVPDDNMASSSTPEHTHRGGRPGEAREVPTTTLTAVLDQAGITKLDYLSMDIELAEPAALAGLDIDRFRPELVCIEGHPEVRQRILDYFHEHGYVLIGKYLRIDPQNLYFKPFANDE